MTQSLQNSGDKHAEQGVETFSLDETNWQGVSLTESAAAQIRKLMQQNPKSKGLSLGVKQSGCAGFGYVFEMIDNPTDQYLVFEQQGAFLFVSKKAMPFIDGTVVDYVREGLNQMFKFNNPKAQHACGCGESFGV
ncbi:Fe-S cluster assembly scaffold SufA [Moellerella wisconsensis]|uniref:SufA family iron-sulfur cluster assembly iron binding protein n=3 Tax=Moellerella wisconsensis TaxID=158849 RepID=A0A0N0I9T7_9GAMM|nr:Fe-S cluster assembly scaffold SufA [Moellerella wisconsensis]KLN97262.1 iron-sulfur cluster assembly scaffold protein [Moellerella wisconsensis]KPD02463.1 SufA family iron-sulfur cluster assembly iron binding protein [Moellerella wisconsensis ATCC 35017]UNH25374.1 Fe-S cluster assembly scaffold SufA [Moellerella wisconsensis]UNH28559.1 Fe-S cluster assembly scaffold SufA [Moellerella wisconsensis]UNH32013.1 Fe-S cluster assembly scaffold SufA [Moellerella wisconsensis]